MASPYFENYSRNLQRILMAEFVDNLRHEGRDGFAAEIPGLSQRHGSGNALRLAFAAMEPIPMPERAL